MADDGAKPEGTAGRPAGAGKPGTPAQTAGARPAGAPGASRQGGAPGRENYNRVLEFYSDKPDGALDLVGLIAYGLYKRQKRDWIIAYKASHGGRDPSDAEIAAVTSSYLTPDLRYTLRDRAAEILSRYGHTYVEAEEPRIREEAIANETLRQARAVERSISANSGFLRQVGTGLIATALWTILVTAILIGAWLFGSDLVDGWQSFTGRAP